MLHVCITIYIIFFSEKKKHGLRAIKPQKWKIILMFMKKISPLKHLSIDQNSLKTPELCLSILGFRSFINIFQSHCCNHIKDKSLNISAKSSYIHVVAFKDALLFWLYMVLLFSLYAWLFHRWSWLKLKCLFVYCAPV